MDIIKHARTLKRHLRVRADGEAHLKKVYQESFGKVFDFNKCHTFTDKLFRRMILMHRRGEETYSDLADKILARNHIHKILGDENLVKILWQGADAAKIPFDDLPEKCIIKVNNRCGKIILFDKTSNRQDVMQQLDQLMSENFYWACREYQYYDIRPQILIEEYLDDGKSEYPLDYRFWCFNGQPEMIQVDNREHNINPFYDLYWERLPLQYRPHSITHEIPKPENFQEMLRISRLLSAGHDFVRVDLYNINGKIYFSELSFTPAAGHIKFQPEKWNMILGQKWIIPEMEEKRRTSTIKPTRRPANQEGSGGMVPVFRSFFW